MYKSLQGFVSDIQASKVPNLTSVELEANAKALCESLKAGWYKINKLSGLPETTDITSGEIKPETISLWMWNWFMNLTASRSIYFKQWGKNYNVGKITNDWIKYSATAEDVFTNIKSFQKERMS